MVATALVVAVAGQKGALMPVRGLRFRPFVPVVGFLLRAGQGDESAEGQQGCVDEGVEDCGHEHDCAGDCASSDGDQRDQENTGQHD